MNVAPTVSIVTPFLNAERYLREAIESVRAQTWRDWELLLVDDGSTDGGGRIAREYVELAPARIRRLEHPGRVNLGISATRNLGAAHARGRCLAFLDGDDVYLPEKLTRQVAFLEAHPDIDAVFGDSLYWHSWTGTSTDYLRDRPRHLRIPADTTIEPGALLPALIRRAVTTPATCSVLIRREAFDRIGGFEPRFRLLYEDQVFFVKLWLHCRTYMAAGILDRYRQHADSCCAVALRQGAIRSDGGPSPSRRRFLEWVSEYVRDQAPRAVGLRCTVALERWLQHVRA